MVDKENLTRHNILLRRGDLDAINAKFPGKASAIIRNLVRNFVLTQLHKDEKCD